MSLKKQGLTGKQKKKKELKYTFYVESFERISGPKRLSLSRYHSESKQIVAGAEENSTRGGIAAGWEVGGRGDKAETKAEL